ncbi:DUF3291 domain-containing protein [Myxococcota bacterium]|nr:DUF3291 domain-containing protein [Myxococcota bacterium]
MQSARDPRTPARPPWRALFSRFFPLFLAGCPVAKPFSGPGYDRAIGAALGPGGDTVIVAITNAKLDGRARGDFDLHTKRIIASLDAQPGFIGASVRTRLFGDEVWTMTAWDDEASLDAFVTSRVHLDGMKKGSAAVTAARFARIEVPRRELPLSWARAVELLDARGDGY